MVSLEEYAKINNLLANCNDMINGKFILADYKIANILKNIAESQEVYNLLASSLNNFDFEREFSRAQLTSATNLSKFVIPTDEAKVLPFIFCVLVNINNKAINFDAFLKKFFSTTGDNKAEEFSNFAQALIIPFRDRIAQYFEVSSDKVEEIKTQNKQNMEVEMKNKTEDSYEEDLENEKEIVKQNYADFTAERVEQVMLEVKSICQEILSEISFDKRCKIDLKDNIIYITKAIIDNCLQNDLKNVSALITAFEYVASKAKSIKFLSRELKRILIEFYET